MFKIVTFVLKFKSVLDLLSESVKVVKILRSYYRELKSGNFFLSSLFFPVGEKKKKEEDFPQRVSS